MVRKNKEEDFDMEDEEKEEVSKETEEQITVPIKQIPDLDAIQVENNIMLKRLLIKLKA